jgi:hypothetical protein
MTAAGVKENQLDARRFARGILALYCGFLCYILPPNV